MRLLGLCLMASAAFAQQLDLSALDKLASRASESSTVTLDEAKLKLASQFLSSEDTSQQKVRDLVSGLRAIFVRSFEFDRPGQYAMSDLEPIRRQLTAPGWSNIVAVKERDELTDVWLFNKGDKLDGIVVVSAEPDEVTVVNIVGPVDINALRKLAGSFGIPNIGSDMFGTQTKRPAKPEPPKKEKQNDDDNR